MRLLQRTIRSYSILSFCVLAIGIPVFYFFLQNVVKQETDEELLVNRSKLIQRLDKTPGAMDPGQPIFLDQDITVHPQHSTSLQDQFSTTFRYDSAIDETIPIRLLQTSATIHGKWYRLTVAAPMVDHNDLIEIVLVVQVVLLALLFTGLWVINRSVSSAYLLQREFTENAAHEMQTPLAVFQSKLELLMQTSPMTREQADLIGNMGDASQRLNRLNKALVLLARIQSQQFADMEIVDISTLLIQILDQYEDAIIQKNIHVNVHQPAPVKLTTNKTLMEILIGNLLSNSIRHNFQDGSVDVFLDEKDLIFKNTGRPEALNKVNLFQRFQKNSADQNSLGLGLEIVDKICTLNHFNLKYQYTKNLHVFSVKFR